MAKQSKKTGELPEILSNSKFYVELSLDNSEEIDAFFMDCSGMSRSVDVTELAEVTPNKWGKDGKGTYGRIRRTKLPGNASSSNITLKRGLCNSETLWEWFAAVEVGRWHEKFRNGDITIYDQGHTEQARFRFTGAWPSSYKIGDLAAGGSELEIEEVELVVAQFYRVTD